MPPIYIVQQGSKVRVSNRRLLVNLELEGEKPETLVSMPINQVSQVVLFGNIGITTPAIGILLDEGIDVAFLTRDGHFRGHLTSGLTPHVRLRRAQYQRIGDEAFQLRLAKAIVKAKLTNQKYFLSRNGSRERQPGLAAIIERIGLAVDEVERKTLLTSLRGVEGSGAAAYFLGFHSCFEPEWKFETRKRRPPTDPVNAMLSFGYTLLAQAATSAVQAAGFDPYAGFLHEVVYNRPALGLDLMEEFRTVVDGIVLRAVNTRAVTPQDFDTVHPEGSSGAEYAIYLSDAAKRKFIQMYENRMNKTMLHPERNQQLSLRQCISEQARQLARGVEQDVEYSGLLFR
ncbi:MAG: CRISPR-associated endonuclease Cas1 [Anaerolineae bacterium]|nr:CRISPR-associated endonuclease Cas1 [Anaerolineae bacterium]